MACVDSADGLHRARCLATGAARDATAACDTCRPTLELVETVNGQDAEVPAAAGAARAALVEADGTVRGVLGEQRR